MRRPRRPALAAVLVLAMSTVGIVQGAAVAAHNVVGGGPVVFGDDDYAFDFAPIAVNDHAAATPYPSDAVSGVPGAILDVDVELLNVGHTWPDDLDVLLVGPGGQQATLMSDVGGSTDLAGANLVFDDEAASAMPDDGPVTSGMYRPTNAETLADPYPVPAPPSTGATSLSVFDGLPAEGTWRLFVVDDGIGDVGNVTGGWLLKFTMRSDPYPSTATVAGLGVISDVDVDLHGLTSGYADDVDLLLQGPGGQQVTLVSDAGGALPVAGLDLTIDDEAPTAPPDSGPMVAGTYRPSNYDTLKDAFPAPAPPSNGTTSLAVFDGLSPNGTWRLFAVDDSHTAVATLVGWSLDLTWADTTAPGGAVTVDAAAAVTSSASVTLGLTAQDPAPGTGVTQMRFSNDGTTFAAYQPFAATATWTLPAADGTKTVYAQFRDAEGNESVPVSDTIVLDTHGPRAVRTTPKDKATAIKVTTRVQVKVSEALDGSTVNKKTVYLKAKGSTKKIKARVTCSASGKTIVLKPRSSLAADTRYQVTVTSKVEDVAGNAFDVKPTASGAQALKFSFRTG